MNNGTASPSQFIQVMNAIGIAVASVIQNFSITELISLVQKNGDKLVSYMHLVFSALVSGRELGYKIKLPVWQKFQIGFCESSTDLTRLVRNYMDETTSNFVNELAKARPLVYINKKEVNLYVLTPEILGFKDGATFREIVEEAALHGLLRCPWEIALYIRLKYQQPDKEWLRLAMEPYQSPSGVSILAIVHSSSGLKLDLHNGDPDQYWKPKEEFIFMD